MKKWKNLTRAALFLIIFALLFWHIQQMLIPRWDAPAYVSRQTRVTEGLFAEPDGSLDALWLGTSHLRQAISPIEIYRETGIRSYVSATDSQPLEISGWLLKAAMDHQRPQAVFLDVSAVFNTNSVMDTANWRRVIDSLPWREFRYKYQMTRAMNAALGSEEAGDVLSGISGLLPIIKYHTAIAELPERTIDWERGSTPNFQKGHGVSGMVISASNPVTDVDGEIAELHRRETLQLGKNPTTTTLRNSLSTRQPIIAEMKRLCEERGAKLILMKVPVVRPPLTYAAYWSQEKHDLIQGMADELGLTFLDLNQADLGLDWSADTVDRGSHVNEIGAVKISRYMADWIAAQGLIQPSAMPVADAAWKQQAVFADEESRYALRQAEHDPVTYLNRLSEDNLTILAAVHTSVGGPGWTEALSAAFSAATGAKRTLLDSENDSYCLVAKNGTPVMEQQNPLYSTASGTLTPGHTYSIASRGRYQGGGGVSIQVDGVTYTDSGAGMHIVVYDNDLECVVDYLRVVTDKDVPALVRPNLPFVTKYYAALIREYKAVAENGQPLPRVLDVSVLSDELRAGTSQVFTVTTDADSQYLTLYTETGGLVETYAASDTPNALSGDTRVWTIRRAIANPGARQLVFRAGHTAGAPGFVSGKAIFTVYRMYTAFDDCTPGCVTPVDLATAGGHLTVRWHVNGAVLYPHKALLMETLPTADVQSDAATVLSQGELSEPVLDIDLTGLRPGAYVKVAVSGAADDGAEADWIWTAFEITDSSQNEPEI